MRQMQKSLQLLASWCFGAFLVCAIAAAISGVLVIWQTSEGAFAEALNRTFLTAILLTLITGILVSGVRSMAGVFTDGPDG